MDGAVTKLNNSNKIETEESDLDFVRRTLSEGAFGREPKVWRNMDYFSDAENAVELRALSKGLTIREILDFYAIGHFSDLSPTDKHFFCVQFLKGRRIGTYNAVTSLFKQMDGVQGLKASLEYLRRNGEGWQGDVDVDDGVPKAIRIVLEDS